MKKVLLVEYLGHCDRNNNPIGHPVKVLEEYVYLLKDMCEVSLAAPKNIMCSINLTGIQQYYELPYFFRIDDARYTDKVKVLKNIETAIKTTDYDYIWFVNVTPFLFKILTLHFFKRKKVICTVYQQKYELMISNICYKYCEKNIHFTISTLKMGETRNKSLYIPDFVYIKDKYDKYQKMNKKDKVVCLGTVGREKKLEELIEVFNKLNYPLEIIGHFWEKKRAEILMEKADSNIFIEDTYLSEEEYLSKLAEAKYAVLPYDEVKYHNRTSGVLQECIFVDTVPITFDSILKSNMTVGIGINNIKDILDINLHSIDTEFFKDNYLQRRKNEFSEEIIREKLVQLLQI